MKLLQATLIVLISAFVFSCKSDSASGDVSETGVVESDTPKKYTITPFTRSQQYPNASIGEMQYTDGRFSFGVSGDDYKLGEQTPDADQKMCANSGNGQHIHLIVDTQPYAAKYEASFEHEVEDGEHNILAFLSRSYHESIKTEEARVAKKVNVQGGTITSAEDLTDPILFYSRPKGTYVGDDTKKIMLDFYPLNVEIGEEYKIKLQVNGEVTMLDKWQPYYIEGLPMGQNTIGIALVYPDGTQVPGSQTAMLNRITLREDPLPEN